MTRRISAAVLSLLLLTVLFAGCAAKHQVHEDLSFDLPRGFEDRSAAPYAVEFDFLYDNGTVALSGIRETRQALSTYFGQLDAQQYAQLVIRLNGLTCEPAQKDGLWYFAYEAVSGGIPTTYLCAIYEAQDSLWQVQAYCATADFAAQQDTMWALITSMEVS